MVPNFSPGASEGHGLLQAHALLARLLHTDTDEVPAVVREMAPYRCWVDPLLREAHAQARKDHAPRKLLHTSLALLPADATQVDYLYERLLDADPGEALVLRDALFPHKQQLVDKLWAVVEAPGTGKQPRRLRAAAALAKFAPDSEHWARLKDQVVTSMVTVQPFYLDRWIKALWPIRATLLDSLVNVHRDPKRDPSERTVATIILAGYAADRPFLLADLLLDSDEEEFPYLYPKLAEYGDALLILQHELNKILERNAAPQAKRRLAKRQANAAVAVLRMGQPEKAWPLLKHRADPTTRSYLIHRLGPLGANPNDIFQQLLKEQDLGIRRALILSLGEFTDAQFPPSERSELIDKLLAIYAEDSDTGVHAAAEWLLRKWGMGKRIKGVTDGLRASEAQLPKDFQAKVESARWYINREGQTMVVLRPKEFAMGSPECERRVRINRTFAISAKAVTAGEFRRLYPEHPCSKHPKDWPAAFVSWYEAAAYCNSLSQKMGLDRHQWCFETDREEKVTGLKKGYLSLTGYRLPTEAEMEYAIRAGATTSRFYGEPGELLVKYGWIVTNFEGSAPVGRLKPNDFGLFDAHGNVWCWCLEADKEPDKNSPRGEAEPAMDDKELEEAELAIHPQQPRVVRGNCYTDLTKCVRSFSRWSTLPGIKTNLLGFCLARTIARD